MWPLTAFFRSSSCVKRLPVRCSSIFGNRKKSDGARSGLYEGCPKMSQWNCSRSKACVCRVVCGRPLSCKRAIPYESLPLRQDNLNLIGLRKTNNTSHLTVGGILNRHEPWPQYFCIYHVTRSDVQLLQAILNITLNTRNQWSAATKQVRGLCAQTFFTFWMASYMSSNW